MNVLLHCTLAMCETVRKSRSPVLHIQYVGPHLYQCDTSVPLGGQVSAHSRALELGRRDFTHIHTRRGRTKKKQGALDPSVRHPYDCANRMWEDRRRPIGKAL